MSEKVRVAVAGACGTTVFAWVAQMVLVNLLDHPCFELEGLVAERPREAGSTFGAAMRGWYEERALPPQYKNLEILPSDGQVLRKKGVGLVISCLPPALSKTLDGTLAEAGMAVVSESPAWRNGRDIPLVVPEINADHLSILPAQQARRGWKGFIVSNPVCTVTILALSMKPILEKFGIERVFATTLQAVSGAGPTGVSAMAIIDNVLPYIEDEEVKLYREGRKIFGPLGGDRIAPADFPISATCLRVPVLHGHTLLVSVECQRPVTAEGVAEAMREFRGQTAGLELPTAPAQPIRLTDDPTGPQPHHDREGTGVTVGRIRIDEALPNGIKYVVCGHNHARGTAGNTMMNAELLYKKGLLV